MKRLSVIIITKDEEKKIRRCLDSVKWSDEIVVVDQSSADRTADICREYTDKVFVVSPKGFCEPDRTTALSKTANEWVLYVDADEAVSPELASEIRPLLSGNPGYGCYYIPRKNIFLGRWIKGSGWYPGYVLRLFKKGAVRFSNDIHGDTIPLEGYGHLKNHLIHYTCEDLKDYIDKSNRYTSVMARQAYDKGERISAKNFIWRMLIVPAVYFFHRLIFKFGWRDGYRGVLIGCLTFRAVFLKNIKLWRMQRGCLKNEVGAG